MASVSVSKLFAAVRERDRSEIATLLNQGADPNAVDPDRGESCLAIAAELGDELILNLLLTKGADPSGKGSVLPPLLTAAAKGHVRIIEQLLDAGADINAVDEEGGTALSSAAAAGRVDAVIVLIEEGIDIRRKDQLGKLAIDYAIEAGHDAVVDHLLPYAPPRAKRRLELRRLFLSQSVDREAVMAFVEAARLGRLDEVRRRIEEGFPVDTIESEAGCTALMWAANRRKMEVVMLLLDHGADVEWQDAYGNTPLVMAAKNGAGKVYEFLFKISSAKNRRNAERYKNVTVARGQWRE